MLRSTLPGDNIARALLLLNASHMRAINQGTRRHRSSLTKSCSLSGGIKKRCSHPRNFWDHRPLKIDACLIFPAAYQSGKRQVFLAGGICTVSHMAFSAVSIAFTNECAF